jgi:hypothetical protein
MAGRFGAPLPCAIVFYVGLNLFGQIGRCTFGGLAIIW